MSVCDRPKLEPPWDRLVPLMATNIKAGVGGLPVPGTRGFVDREHGFKCGQCGSWFWGREERHALFCARRGQ
jgi:hypothetical protein